MWEISLRDAKAEHVCSALQEISAFLDGRSFVH